MRTEQRTFADYLAVLRRRWKLSAAAGSAVLLGFVVYAYTATAIYEAVATIQVERPIMPDATAAAFPDQQLVPVTQRVLSTQNIAGVIEKFELYGTARETVPMEDLARGFRDSVVVTPTVVSTTMSGNRPVSVTYEYSIAFYYDDAEKASAVANELANLHVSENSAMRTGTAARASAFLQAESDKVAKEIAEVQAKMAALLSQGGGAMASQDPMMAAQRYEQIDRELAQVDAMLRAARERKDVLEAEALQTPRYRAIMTDGETILRGEDRLIVAQQELVAAQARYSDNHPDVVRLKREIASLTGGQTDYRLKASQLRSTIAMTEEQLVTARESYSDDHPDVVRLQRNLESLQQQLADAEAQGASPASQPQPDNPLYLQLQTRIRTAEIEVNELSARRSALASRLNQYAYDPEMDARFAPLVRERDLLRQQYENLRERYTQATLAESVETQEEGQVLILAEAARPPSSPAEPNRPIVILLGFLLAFGTTIGVAMLMDFLDASVRGSRDIESLLHQAPLALIPVIDTPADVAHRRRTHMLMAIVGLTVIAIVVVVTL